jgi:hypothetical protein
VLEPGIDLGSIPYIQELSVYENRNIINHHVIVPPEGHWKSQHTAPFLELLRSKHPLSSSVVMERVKDFESADKFLTAYFTGRLFGIRRVFGI